jgi:hypothetical protein
VQTPNARKGQFYEVSRLILILLGQLDFVADCVTISLLLTRPQVSMLTGRFLPRKIPASWLEKTGAK